MDKGKEPDTQYTDHTVSFHLFDRSWIGTAIGSVDFRAKTISEEVVASASNEIDCRDERTPNVLKTVESCTLKW